MPNAAWTPELEQWLQQQALASGFDAAGIAPVATRPGTGAQLTAERFTTWIEQGYAGEMDYLKRRDASGVLLRSDIQTAFPWARSVIVCAFNYNADAPLSIDPAPAGTGWIARYAWSGRDATSNHGDDARYQSGGEPEGQHCAVVQPKLLQPTDYHDELLTRLRSLESSLQQSHPCQTRCYVDTGPLIERAAAAQAGIGWIGKNTCILNQQPGSWLLLGVILTSLPVAEDLSRQLTPDRCGSCTRCIDACPTDALIAPRQMDASRCISYLTIEKKGAIPEELRPLMGRQVFGCDICQDVCPWNRKSRPELSRPKPGMIPRAELINPPLDWLAAMDAVTFKRYFKGSPLERTRRKRLLRNVAIAMGNSAQQHFLPTLQRWSAAVDDPILAEAAQWAIRRLEQHLPSPLC